MTKEEIIDYLYNNHVHGDVSIEQMAEDLAPCGKWVSAKEYRQRRSALTGETIHPNDVCGLFFCNQCWRSIGLVQTKFCPSCGSEMS